MDWISTSWNQYTGQNINKHRHPYDTTLIWQKGRGTEKPLMEGRGVKKLA